jgi:cAMP-dependent protein kinase regulator
MRESVSAEAYGAFNKKKENFVATVITKTEDQKKRIRTKLNMSFMFKALDEKEKLVVIDAMEEK